MATSRIHLKQTPTDVWSTREKLALACSVLRSGDQNWVSVSRAIKSYGEENRPGDWFSQKNCALQYSDMLEKVETPRRKRNDNTNAETPGMVIVRKLTIERIEELRQLVSRQQERYKTLKQDAEMLKAGMWDDKLPQIWEEMEEEKKKNEEAEAQAYKQMMESRQQAHKLRLVQIKAPIIQKSTSEGDDSTMDSIPDSVSNSCEDEASNTSLPPSTSATPQPDSSITVTPTALDGAHKQSSAEDNVVADEEPEFKSDIPQQVEVSKEPCPAEQPTKIKEEPASSEMEVVKTALCVNSGSEGDCEQNVAEVKEEPTTPVKTDSPAFYESSHLYLETVKPDVLTSEEDPHKVTGKHDEATDIEDTDETQTPDTPRDKPFDLVQHPIAEKQDDAEELDVAAEGNIFSQDPGCSIDDEPLSPSSNISDNSTRGKGGKRHSSRASYTGKVSKVGRRSQRLKGGKASEEVESNKPSEAESSDDEVIVNLRHLDTDQESMTPRLVQPESVPGSPASATHSDTEDEKNHKIWKKSIMLVWRSAANHKYANLFLHPVSNIIAPGYNSVVFRPMDLSSIKKNIESGATRTTSEFQRDMMLMFTNAIMYNSSDHNVYKMAQEMYNDVMTHIEQFVSTQLMVNTKVLRTSRRSDVKLDKLDTSRSEEEDSRKRKPVDVESGGKAKKRK